jgi:CheY-like chemotaxis protein
VTTGLAFCSQDYLRSVIGDNDISPGSFVYAEISDTGCGMDDAILSRVFEPFFTTKFTGRGLGMAAVLGILRGHKGAIAINSTPGRGTTCRVLFPALEEEPFENPEISRKTSSDWKCTGGVLLVDDEESNRSIAEKMLQTLGFTVFIAEDGRKALEQYQDHRAEIGLVVLDLIMPEMDGEETFRELQIINPALKVIISSGYTEQEVSQRFEGKNIAGFVAKPYTLETLRNTLRSVLGESYCQHT